MSERGHRPAFDDAHTAVARRPLRKPPPAEFRLPAEPAPEPIATADPPPEPVAAIVAEPLPAIAEPGSDPFATGSADPVGPPLDEPVVGAASFDFEHAATNNKATTRCFMAASLA